MLTVKYCEPFNGRLALHSMTFVWLKRHQLLDSPLWGKEITEQDLHDYIVETDPKHQELFKMIGIAD